MSADRAVIDEFDGLELVCDPDDAERPDLVQGATQAARTLAGLVVRRRVRSALDLGTGCGVLALTLARHAERVVGTDVNPRAVRFARLSAQRNGIGNVEWREGDWYAPVRGERFDLIACNPPYVISPDDRLLYRDGSQATEGVVREAGAHLTAGGLAHLLINFAHPPDDWARPLRSWIPTGCDALVVHHASLRPGQYAETWARPEDVPRWLRWYREQGIEAIGAAFLLLRRREDDGPPRLQALEAGTPSTQRAGVHLGRILRGTDLASGGDAALLAARLRVVDGVRVERTARRRGGAWEHEEAIVRVVPTVGVQATVPGELADLVLALDGSRPAREVVARRGDEALAVVRRLVELGFAEPA
jgi:methylase of polypeptide subunit release factors